MQEEKKIVNGLQIFKHHYTERSKVLYSELEREPE